MTIVVIVLAHKETVNKEKKHDVNRLRERKIF